MELGKHVQLTLDLFQPSAANATVCLSCFTVCFRFFRFVLFPPCFSNREHLCAAKENVILRHVLRIEKYVLPF